MLVLTVTVTFIDIQNESVSPYVSILLFFMMLIKKLHGMGLNFVKRTAGYYNGERQHQFLDCISLKHPNLSSNLIRKSEV